ncbi:hypothetical protein UY3_16290 [Chelonia mydas]|uniref:Uncharacterized protein n=1 Tax=Chelonia mydas TaxID=8469 RepID=M7APT7_CHEMY|nr:hypothetical protein UY3_16290 [Chelonia mydas]
MTSGHHPARSLVDRPAPHTTEATLSRPLSHTTEGTTEPAPDPTIVQVTSDLAERLVTNATQEQPGHIVGQNDPVPPLASSSSSSDEVVAGTSASCPPPIDQTAHQDLLRCVARNMGLQVEEAIKSEDPVVDILAPEGPSRVAFLVIKTICNNYNTLWQTPASIPPTARGVERKYFVPSKGYEFLFSYPHLCSLVVLVVNEKEHQGQQALAPKAKEAKCIDLFGRKVYAMGGLQLGIANQEAILSRYNFNSWDSMSKYKELLSTESKAEFSALVEEGKAVAKTSPQVSLDLADSAARTISSEVVMRRTAWLQASGLPLEVQQPYRTFPLRVQSCFRTRQTRGSTA